MLARLRASIDDSDEGFTLVELLVVIIIIGILAAIAIPVFLNQRKKGYQASMKADLRMVANEMETYNTDFQTYVGAVGGVGATSGSIAVSGSVGSDFVTLSQGNTITVVTEGTIGFCLKASTTKSSGVVYYFDSTKGGIQPASTTGCSGTYS